MIKYSVTSLVNFCILISFSICTLIEPASAYQGALISQKVKENITKRVESELSPAIVLAVYSNGKTEYFCYGLTAYRSDLRVSKDTIFEIGSITKVFTSLLLAEMVSDGRLSLDAEINSLLPDMNSLPVYDDTKISLKHLATHTSGLPYNPLNLQVADGNDPFADYRKEDLLSFISTYTLPRKPGTEYEYSNTGVGLLGNIITDLSGMEYAELLREMILKKLKMTNTVIDPENAASGILADGHRGKNAVPYLKMPALQGAGPIKSSAKDMLAFIESQVSSENSPFNESIKLMQEQHFVVNDRLEMGLGWHIVKENSRTIYMHGGLTGGFSSFTGFDKERKYGIVILSNSSESIEDIGMHLLLDRNLKNVNVVKPDIKVDRNTLTKYVGEYRLDDEEKTMVYISRVVNRLLIQMRDYPKRQLFPISQISFFVKNTDVEVEFILDDTNTVTSLKFSMYGKQQSAKKIKRN